MSCFAGLLNLDGAPADPAQLDRMAERLAFRSPDGIGRWVDGPIGLVHGGLWTTPEEVGERQPVSDPALDLRLATDARIDNRSELLARLRGQVSGIDDETSDARLILAAYQVDGDELCEGLIGDFAFALWDGSRRRLLLARDAMGMRQLYYRIEGSTVVFGSSIGAVLAALPDRLPLNRPLIESFLRGSFRHWIRETVFDGLLRVPPGHLLAVGAEGSQLRDWWRLGSTFTGACSSDEEWVEAFREVFDEAVRCRLRSTTPVGLLTGGGLDSSAIASTAHAALGGADAFEGAHPFEGERAGKLCLTSLTFDDTPSADESEYFDELAGWIEGAIAQRIPADELPLSLGPAAGDDHPLDEPEVYLLRSHTAALFAGAARHGCRVVLAGEGANQVLRHSFYYDPSALGLVGWRNLMAELPWFRAASQVRPFELLPRAFLWPLLPAALHESLRRLKAGSRNQWVRPAGRGSWRRRLPALARRALADSLPRSGRWASQSIGRPFDLARYSALDVTAAHAGVEWRLPFLDRRVVDLLLHAPAHLFSWRGDDRQILRRAMAGRMPERIRVRASKSHVRDVLDRRLKGAERPVVERMLDKPRAEAVDCVTSSVAAALDAYWNGTGTVYGLLSFLSLESWLRRTFKEGC